MKVTNYPEFNEQMITTTLKNGLTVYLQPKSGFKKINVSLSVNYGSVDNEFTLNGEAIKQPAGIAHFIEHKMFDKKDYDVFELFGQTGAKANAFTSFTRTNYVFSTTDKLKENLLILLNFVLIPYFNEAKIEKEKGIINQEINMYQNDPDNQIYNLTLANLYRDSVIEDDISGTVASVAKIDLQAVELAYETFYRPENMSLVIVGDFESQALIEWLNQVPVLNRPLEPVAVTRRNWQLHETPAVAVNHYQMDVVRPKVAIGIRQRQNQINATIRDEIALSLIFDMFFSENSTEYMKLYYQQIIDDSFYWEFESQAGFSYAIISCDTERPQELIDAIMKIIKAIPDQLLKMKAEFELQKNEQLGNYIAMMDSTGAIINEFDPFTDEKATIYDEVTILNDLNLADLVTVAQRFFNNSIVRTQVIDNE